MSKKSESTIIWKLPRKNEGAITWKLLKHIIRHKSISMQWLAKSEPLKIPKIFCKILLRLLLFSVLPTASAHNMRSFI